MLLFCSYKTNVVTDEKTKSKKAVGGKRVMYSTHNPCWDAKNRFNFPDSMEMSFSEIASAFKAPADIKADTIAELRKMFQVTSIKEDDVMAYLKAKGQTDGSSLEELSLKTLQFVKTNSDKIITKLQEEKEK